ncbi:hypothetical protein EYF80_027777 [Liparis tanakae]|uniref:Uncharacterized protein n=1 Tax=Liparis tanakae TaxID=230148 RepID=A0A4Z2H897_9TELE|nr:hypothetical protein EYF80_027777 [Liparis tanakae]
MGSRGVSTESPPPPPLHRRLLILRSNVPFSSTSRPGLWKNLAKQRGSGVKVGWGPTTTLPFNAILVLCHN